MRDRNHIQSDAAEAAAVMNGRSPGNTIEARASLQDVTQLVRTTIQSARSNNRIEFTTIHEKLDAFLDFVLADPDEMQWLISIQPKQQFLNRRAIGTAILCAAFGKHLGFGREEILHLALGGLLLDIGKVTVPITILAKPGRLTAEERWFTNRHVEKSLSMLQFHTEELDRVIAMIATHHERLDGSGYPNKIGGTEIPLYGRIAGIVDTFDALTLDRRYASARSGYSAIRFLGALRDSKFDANLIDEFIDCIGMYPTGTRVRLHDGSFGLVCGQNAGRPWQPTVMLTTDPAGRPVTSIRMLDVGPNSPISRALPTVRGQA